MGKCIERVLKNFLLERNTASQNNASWHTDTNGFLEHSFRRGSLYYKRPALQKITTFWRDPPSYVSSLSFLGKAQSSDIQSSNEHTWCLDLTLYRSSVTGTRELVFWELVDSQSWSKRNAACSWNIVGARKHRVLRKGALLYQWYLLVSDKWLCKC